MRVAAALLCAALGACDGSSVTPVGRADAGTVTAATGAFRDVRETSGVRAGTGPWPFRFGPANAAALGDCDRDGLPDAFVLAWNAPPTLYRNQGSMRFTALDLPPGLAGRTPSAAAFGDLDGDGLPDLAVALGIEDFVRSQMASSNGPVTQELRVFHNLGGCRFEDVSVPWGFGPWQADHPSIFAGVDLADVNLDGRLDLLTRRVLDTDAPLRLYLSRPDGTWTESATPVLGVVPGANWANFFTDVDGDGLDDLFVLFDERFGPPARFFHRTSASAARPYTEETFDPRIFGPAYNPASLMAAAAGDVDGDGWLDQYLLDIGPQHLYTHRSGRADVAAAAGLDLPMLQPSLADTVGFGASFADYDNDTWADLAFAAGVTEGWYTPPTSFLRHNRGDGTFEDATALLRQPTTFTSLWMTASDLDRDGRVDYWLGGYGSEPRVLRNEVSGGRSVAVRLHGRTSNAEGVGARVVARVGSRTLVQQVQGGGSPWGYGEHRLVFGVGRAAGVDGLEVHWPDGYVQRTGPFAAGAEAVVEEPDLVRVTPAVTSAGGTVQVVVRPAKPDGTLLGPGHRVDVAVDPDGATLTAIDDGAGTYTATTAALAAGLHGFTVRIDGAALFAHPLALAR